MTSKPFKGSVLVRCFLQKQEFLMEEKQQRIGWMLID